MQEKFIKLANKIPWKGVFQRVPGIWLLLLLPFSFIGPVHYPLLFSVYYTFLHILFFTNNCRSCYGMYVAYHSAQLSATTDWLEQYCRKTGARDGHDASHDLPFCDVKHVIILPNYSEDMDTLFETLDVLASHPLALTQYQICLAMEESEKDAENKARTLVKLYADSFFDITFTMHPKGRPGEIRGKSSNVAWAAAQMAKNAKTRSNEIITVMDADTCFAADYFSSITFQYCVASPEQRKILMFAPCTVFDRNSNNVPVFVRITDMFWSIGVISNLYYASAVKIPCSAYSVSMDLAIAVNFWDAGPEAIGEDLHMYLKCFFNTNGHVIVRSVYSPASQCNVEGNGLGGLGGYVSGLKARYTQAKRHLWGSLDTGYTLRKGLSNLLFPKEAQLRLKNAPVDKLGKSQAQVGIAPGVLFLLMHRLVEAHVLMGQLFILITVSAVILPVRSAISFELAAYCWQMISATPVHPYVHLALNSSFWIRLACLIPNIIMIYYYERYHQFVGFERWVLQSSKHVRESLSTNINSSSFSPDKISSNVKHLRVQQLGKRASLYSQRTMPGSLKDWLLIPVAGFLFYVLPQFHAQISHLWTDSLEYKVAAKPQLKPMAEVLVVEDNKSVSSKGDEGYFEEFDDSTASLNV